MDFSVFRNQLYQVFSPKSFLNDLSLEVILDSIPNIDELDSLQKGTVVLIRADLDMPIIKGEVVDYSRIESIAPTIKFCHEKGWKSILFGHVGRDKDNSALPICNALSQYLKIPVVFIEEWLDEMNDTLVDSFLENVNSSPPGTIIMLQNTRKYRIEQALWTASRGEFLDISKRMYKISTEIKNRLTSIEINEGFAASNIDFSSSAIPLQMSKTAVGYYLAKEFKEHIQKVRYSNFVVFSGLKINKLDDLEGIVDRGKLKLIISAGSLAMALLKARSILEKKDFSIGLAELDTTAKSYISSSRINQAIRITQKCTQNNIELILPIDFVLSNNQISEYIPDDLMQMDIGPKTIKLFEKTVKDYIKESKSSSIPFVMFFNGVFGKFEDPQFSTGTRSFIPLLKLLTDEGVMTFVGGGEGRLALQKYGSLNDVTHAFTAGGTVLKSLTNMHIAYLKAMFLQNTFNKE